MNAYLPKCTITAGVTGSYTFLAFLTNVQQGKFWKTATLCLTVKAHINIATCMSIVCGNVSETPEIWILSCPTVIPSELNFIGQHRFFYIPVLKVPPFRHCAALSTNKYYVSVHISCWFQWLGTVHCTLCKKTEHISTLTPYVAPSCSAVKCFGQLTL